MIRFVPLLLVAATASAAPVPKPDPTKDRDGNPLPAGAVARLGSLPFRGPSTFGLTYSPDGMELLSADQEGVHTWDADTGRYLGLRKHAAAGPEGDRGHVLVVGHRVIRVGIRLPKQLPLEHECAVTRRFDGREVSRFAIPFPPSFSGFGDRTTEAAVSADARRLAISRRDELSVYDLETGKTLAAIPVELGDLGDRVHLSADGEVVFLYRDEGGLRRWAVKTGKELPALADGKTDANLLRTSPDGKRVVARVGAVTDARSELVVWDAATGKVTGRLPVAGRLLDVRFVGSDALLVGAATKTTAGFAGSLVRWDLTTRKTVWEQAWLPPRYHADRYYAHLAVSPDESRFAVSNQQHTFATFDAATGKLLGQPGGHGSKVERLWFSAAGDTVTTFDGRDVRVWDATTGVQKSETAPELFRTGDMVPVDHGEGIVWERTDAKGKPEVIGWNDGKELWRFSPTVKMVNRAFSPDGKAVFLVGGDKLSDFGTAELHDGPSGRRLGRWPTDGDYWNNRPLLLSPDGATFHTPFDRPTQAGAKDERPPPVLATYATATGKRTAVFDIPWDWQDYAWTGRVSADGSKLLMTEPDGRSWAVVDTRTKKVVWKTPRLPEDEHRFGIPQLSPNGKLVLAVGQPWSGVSVMAVGGDGKQRAFAGGVSDARAVAFNRDGTKMAVGYGDGTALVWSLAR